MNLLFWLIEKLYGLHIARVTPADGWDGSGWVITRRWITDDGLETIDSSWLWDRLPSIPDSVSELLDAKNQ